MFMMARLRPRSCRTWTVATASALAMCVAVLTSAGASQEPVDDAGVAQPLPRGATEVLWVDEPQPLRQALAPERLRFAVSDDPLPPGEPGAYLSVWWRDSGTGRWLGWRGDWPPFVNTLHRFEPGERYVLFTTAALEWLAPPTQEPSIFERAQVVSFYGYPGIPIMGILGAHTAEQAAIEVEAWAERYDALNDELGAIGALHLIVAVAQRHPGADGTYLGRLAGEVLDEYVEVTRARGQLLFLDVQIGWSDPLTETRRLEPWLREPHVHLALDPEFATRRKEVAPGRAVGTVTGAEIN
jgi:hypothetical protein